MKFLAQELAVRELKTKLGLTGSHVIRLVFWNFADHTPPSCELSWEVSIFKGAHKCEIGKGPTFEVALARCEAALKA